MGQKVHPIGFRLSIFKNHQARWYANEKDYSTYFLEDLFIRQYILEKCSDAGIVKIHIERNIDIIRISMLAAQPRAFTYLKEFTTLNRNKTQTNSQKTLETKNEKKFTFLTFLRDKLTSEIVSFRKKSFLCQKPRTLRNKLYFGRPEIELYIKKLNKPFRSASYIGNSVALEIEKRVPFRRAMKFALRNAQRAGVLGVKIQISGRLNGAEIARTEWLRRGRIPLHTLRAKIDYSCQTAKTLYGLIGIKVWVFRGMIK